MYHSSLKWFKNGGGAVSESVPLVPLNGIPSASITLQFPLPLRWVSFVTSRSLSSKKPRRDTCTDTLPLTPQDQDLLRRGHPNSGSSASGEEGHVARWR